MRDSNRAHVGRSGRVQDAGEGELQAVPPHPQERKKVMRRWDAKDFAIVMLAIWIVILLVFPLVKAIVASEPQQPRVEWEEIDPPYPGLRCWVAELDFSDGVWCEPINEKKAGQ